MGSLGFLPTASDPCVFVAHSADPLRRCVVLIHVDDGFAMGLDESVLEHLVAGLMKRYGPITLDKTATNHVGWSVVLYWMGFEPTYSRAPTLLVQWLRREEVELF